MNRAMLTVQVWLGRVAAVLLLFIVASAMGAEALLWAVPALVTVCFGCYAERDRGYLIDIARIDARLDAVLKCIKEAKRL
jgi:hypothetical protein